MYWQPLIPVQSALLALSPQLWKHPEVFWWLRKKILWKQCLLTCFNLQPQNLNTSSSLLYTFTDLSRGLLSRCAEVSRCQSITDCGPSPDKIAPSRKICCWGNRDMLPLAWMFLSPETPLDLCFTQFHWKVTKLALALAKIWTYFYGCPR